MRVGPCCSLRRIAVVVMVGALSPAAAQAGISHARHVARARAALIRYLRHDSAPMLLAPGGASGEGVAVRNATVSSYNWSGYADESTVAQEFSHVAGSWVTPAVRCTPENQITSEWVGIDGATDSTVEQDGTISWCYLDKPTYFTWYEMYPAGTIVVGSSVQPGDAISASVARAGTTYTLAVTDSTHTANSFVKTATCALSACVDKSAEWIAERPAYSVGIAPLADYSKWTQTNGTVTAGGKSGTISSFAPDAFNMIDATSAYNLSTVSALTSGKSFSTTWLNSW